MKLFLSWSGVISHRIAIVLRDWIPLVLQTVEPYVSSEDIDKGTRWSSDIAKELEESRYGIICITHENLQAPWINFEAGALSKTIEKANVAPLLFNVKKSEVTGPLLQFQLTIYEKEDIRKLINSINNASDGIILDKPKVDKIFDQWWPNLHESLEDILKQCTTVEESNPLKPIQNIEPNESNEKILEELLELARIQVRILKNPEEILPQKYLSFILRHTSIPASRVNTGALKDLERQYRHLRAISRQISIEDIKEEAQQRVFIDLKEAILRIGPPIDYILRKNDILLPFEEEP